MSTTPDPNAPFIAGDPVLTTYAPGTAVASKPPGPLLEFWRSFSANKGALAGLIIIVLIALVAIFADVVAPHSPIDQDRTAFLVPPFWQSGGTLAYPLGTDDIGRDILSRLIHGARLSMMIGLIVVTLSLAMGLLLGLAAGFFGGWSIRL